MDVPSCSAFVMAKVTPTERAAAASPAIGGALFAAGWLPAPLVSCGLLKIAYDVALWRAFRRYEVDPHENAHAQGHGAP